MKTMRQEIIDLRTDWISGKWIPDREEEHWGGAGLIVTDKPQKDDRAVVVVTKYAGEVSSLVVEIMDRLRDWLDFDNKNEFFPRLGEAANRSIKKYGDDLSCLINDILGEAGDIADEWNE